ncbi:MAG: PKD domain-containing protein, partial [Planctomycetes bacterium]|nr:PKD domain-containing protein [Planctomycetota bacterium]
MLRKTRRYRNGPGHLPTGANITPRTEKDPRQSSPKGSRSGRGCKMRLYNRAKNFSILRLSVTIILMANLASITNACLDPPCGDCYEWNGEACDWVGCDPACGDCEKCKADCSGCDPICEDPVAEFDVTGYTDEEDIVVVVGTSLTFDASDSSDPDDTTLNYGWDFGDGGTDAGESVTYAFTEGGEWTVELVVIDSDNTECNEDCPDHYDDATRLVTVLEVDLEAIAAENTPDLVNGRMCFNAQECY